MADVILDRADVFPVGTVVRAVNDAKVGAPRVSRGRLPSLPQIDLAVVAADGKVTFTGLPAGVYVAEAAPLGVYVKSLGSKVWLVALSGATGGTFTIKSGANATTGLAFGVTAAAAQTAVRLLSGESAATVTGSAGGPFTVTLATANTLTAVSSLTGVSPAVARLQVGATVWAAPARIPHPWAA